MILSSRLTLALSALIGLGSLAACQDTAPPTGPVVRVVDASQVGQCRYVINLSDKPGLYGVLAGQAVGYAREQIIREAGTSGANTVVFDKIEPGQMVTELKATAYRC
ncbi:hypothetical protein FGG78_34580 [Thioclava sp. BHET1]|nr:hypothetical protein FGG78_34580 [Thioclava sp. BHET1]